ncbi:MAG: hypothetical protein ACRDP6_29260 [Actinoallomurus sp.]
MPSSAAPKQQRSASSGRTKTRKTSGGSVVHFPGKPGREVNVTIGGQGRPFRYSTGDDGFDRAVYQGETVDEEGNDLSWKWTYRAPLPYVHARVIRRDGAERRIGTDYLISTGPDAPGIVSAPRVLVTDQDLTDGTWAIKLGVNLSSDRNIITAASTALRDVAYQDAHEREATPHPDATTSSGHLDLLVRECLPTGYLATPPHATVEEIRQAWRQIAEIITHRPKMALTLGASCGAPFVGPLRRYSHWWDLYGDPRKGKTTTMALGGAVWGKWATGRYVTPAWNASGQGPGRRLGMLGILPAWWDERGLNPISKPAWGELIYSTCQGASRLTAEYRGPGEQQTKSWTGILFSSGNDRLTDGITSGRFAGIPARVVELAAPFTGSAAEAKQLERLLTKCYGWLGPEILTTYAMPDVERLLTEAEEAVGVPPEGGTPGTIAEHLHLAVAGAKMADATLGTGDAVTSAAIKAAQEYLEEHGHEPEHDADRMLAALAESLVARRPAWPTAAEYAELGRAAGDDYGGRPDPARVQLVQHGYDRELFGVRSDDDAWLYVFPSTWRALAAELGIDSAVTCAELRRRELLHVPDSLRRQGKWSARPRIDGKTTLVYQVAMVGLELDGDEGQDPPAGDTPPPPPSAEPSPAPPAAPSGPCQRCQRQTAEWCGHGWIDGERLPCVCGCGTVTVVRSACGAPRLAHGLERAHEPVAAPAAPAPTVAPVPPPRRAGGGRTAKRQAALDAAKASLDAGEPLRLLRALETTHAPMRRGDDGRPHNPYWRPAQPGIVETAHVVKGWAWSRPYSGPVHVLDKSGAWVAAGSSVLVAHGQLENTGELDDATGLAGYCQVTVYPWTETDMPHPFGTPHESADWQPGGTVWVPAPTVALLRELADADRWPDATVLDSYTAPGVRINEWTKFVNELRAYAITKYGRGDEYDAVKTAYGQAMSLMIGRPKEDGVGWEWGCGVHRPDWTHAIRAQASAMLWRRADQCRQVAPELGPVALRNVDELVIPADALDIVTTTPPPGADKPAVVIDPDGIDLRSFKVKAVEDWTEEQA